VQKACQLLVTCVVQRTPPLVSVLPSIHLERLQMPAEATQAQVQRDHCQPAMLHWAAVAQVWRALQQLTSTERSAAATRNHQMQMAGPAEIRARLRRPAAFKVSSGQRQDSNLGRGDAVSGFSI
jgi:hypothetical protein